MYFVLMIYDSIIVIHRIITLSLQANRSFAASAVFDWWVGVRYGGYLRWVRAWVGWGFLVKKMD